MKKRIISLTLALILLVSVLVVPVHAASAKDVHNYLKEFAKSGEYDSTEKAWYSGFSIGGNDNGTFYFIVSFMENTNYVHNSIAFYANSSNYLSYEVTWKISSNPSPAYNAFVEIYDGSSSADDTTGTVAIGASYDGSAISAFKSFKGDSDYKAVMLNILNTFLPGVLEFTRAVINDNDYALKDLGMTGYKACDFVHAFDHGQVTKQPTCVDAGVMTYTCRVCGTKETEELPATGQHSWDQGTVIQEPSCTEAGTKRFTCSVCGETREETVPALGHAWEYTETLTPATDEEHGTALYTCSRCGETKEAPLCAGEIFTDMPAEDNWAHNAIDWAYFTGITKGTGDNTFSPEMNCTRSQVVTFLWRAAGEPGHESEDCPFTDVEKDSFYYDAMLWAVEKGITKGTGTNTFSPNNICTRSEVVTFLWRAAGEPEPSLTESDFTDVPADTWYTQPVLWAVEHEITHGTSATTFAPTVTCSRAQIVTFLYNASKLPAEDPAPSEPDPSEPDPNEPAPSEPEPSEPAPSEPAPSEPAPSEPAPSEPAPSEPAPSEP